MPTAAPQFRPPRIGRGAACDQVRDNSAQRGYDKHWRRFRAWYLAEHPICERRVKCNGAAATVVDHQVPLARGGAHCDPSNSMAMCKPCHDHKTRTEDMHR